MCYPLLNFSLEVVIKFMPSIFDVIESTAIARKNVKNIINGILKRSMTFFTYFFARKFFDPPKGALHQLIMDFLFMLLLFVCF